ncbi:MAG TPA: thiamine pyrophosphate-dependent enzyme [Bacteroidales bacterium]|jgi:indolepyruvate ferredoxin oxidoreductase alpha subunit|nr:indolepyruvate ferredoxin oxidoreductase [Bacteroidales bacterium]HOB27900.1 thiamine pyrophosphate-dependent enzyme [Bacteroidales bacterium]HPU46992.1 thiamine pyrophosphate-dependent enzyme [Bacteroidales bacterium]HPZ36835.1 thiamine pyrophosphate-dependent enzyme [Bacteroidales bacterium]HQD35177.1 thiamine pyrophosphate-dependent enzyme [Bacteroidales bacterium]
MSPNKLLLLGDEAIAQAAIDAGVSGAYAYPGTPSSEILEYLIDSKEAKQKGIVAEWTANEKTAVEAAIGASYVGKRTIVAMKHVGLNVAADAFINSALTGANGGMIVVTADDPSMHSSQNEQDNRFYGDFAHVPILEPSNQQEAYDMCYYGFQLSEKFHLPVLLRITTRVAHSRAGVLRKESLPQNQISLPNDLKQYILLPALARKRWSKILSIQPSLLEESENSTFNQYINGDDKSIGIIASGIAFNYVMENFHGANPYPIVKISQYPIPEKMIKKLYKEVDRLIVIEEGYPFIEKMLTSFLCDNLKVEGKLTGLLPREGELNPNIVAQALGLPNIEGKDIPTFAVGRPPSFCPGCSHIDSYNALNEALKDYSKGRVFSDIGCYTLGATPPFEAINSCVDMGASIPMAKAASDMGLRPAVAVIGDSTFTHSGMTGLLDAVVYNAPITVMILDNSTTGMTGGQPSHANQRLVSICTGLGVNPEHIRIIKPLKNRHQENVQIIKEELAYEGVSVIIPTRECVQTLNRRMRTKFKEKEANK